MEERTMGIIYAIKKSEYSAREAVRDFMSQWSGTPPEHYTPALLDDLICYSLCDCLNDNEHPSAVMHDYFHFLKEPWNLSAAEAAILTIQNIQIRRFNYETEQYDYINGFKGENKE